MCVGRTTSEKNALMEYQTSSSGPPDFVLKRLEKIIPNDHQKVEVPKCDKEFKEDALAIMTQQTKYAFQLISDIYQRIRSSVFCKILFYTTQPAHLITALSVLYIAYLSFPSTSQSPISPLWTLVYLMSFSTHFGAQIWMTFVSGLALYFSLPRHVFGSVQVVLFPKYFLLNAMLSLVTLAIFLRTKNADLVIIENAIQASGMSVCFLIELVIRLYLTPPLLGLLSEKNAMEKEAGVGMEVGKFSLGKLKQCPHYLTIHKKFRKIHSSIAMLNIVTMACTMLHLYYLSHKICSI